ncbi:PREDICTED: calmodulin-binding protein 60 B-like [Nelumbo nucifera]|uniref:Calmodulin-binding protein 60 B-like n=1 Tax=Nelumbo nucifera TaxID=4432 RepID=A0A1U8A4M8_NELNU|nr:PREDICTED: calmodulin-binding protein 60 B-like [Nelumbo nucifera]XP_010259796.1 PREDICTED: calmodulin-binding protein 60 B-like [Nelumbo nucifera]
MQRQTRYLERSNTMNREKRGLDPSEGEEGQPEKKRPALASVIVEALKVDSLQKLCSSLEPILRRVVSEEVERALAKLGPARLNGRSSPKRIEGPDGRNLQLHFRSRLSLPLFTGGKVEGEQGAAVHVVLLDANTGHVVTTGSESSVKLDVVVLEGDFNNEDDDDWTQEDFESHVVKEREGKRPLLTGDLQVTLKEGVGTLGELTFTDNSSWIRSRKFRLGLKVASGFCEGIRIREAKTDAFTVKDHRGELYKKHYPPALNDDVWRLEKIGKDGSFHKRLNKSGIYTVEDFLRFVVRDQQGLRNILGSGMSNKMWEVLVEHAKTCVLSGKLYVYYSDDTKNVGVVFNNIYELSGLIAGGQYYSADSLSDSQKVYVDTLVKKAYDNWGHVIEYDGKALLSYKQNKRPSSSRSELPMGPEYSNSFDQQISVPRLPVPSEQPSMDSGLNVGVSGYNDNLATRYPAQSQVNSNSHVQFDGNSFAPQNQMISTSHQTQFPRNENIVGLALGPPQSSTPGFQNVGPSIQASNVSSYDDWSHSRENGGVDGFFSEEEIRMRSHEMLENEDMQHLLRIFSMGGQTAINISEEGYSYPSYIPSPTPNLGFDEDRSRSSGKAVVGWLKLKAALRWGIFIRKQAAERRAQLVELDD